MKIYNQMKLIWDNDKLFGHYLTQMPTKLWSFATTNNLYFKRPSGSDVTYTNYCIFEKYTKIEYYPNGNLKYLEVGTHSFLLEYLELGFRRVGGTCFTACACTVAPLGFALKIIHNQLIKS